MNLKAVSIYQPEIQRNVPTQIINELNKIQKEFIWNGRNPKIKHSTLRNKYENGGLINVNILSKVIS